MNPWFIMWGLGVTTIIATTYAVMCYRQNKILTKKLHETVEEVVQLRFNVPKYRSLQPLDLPMEEPEKPTESKVEKRKSNVVYLKKK